METLNSIVIYNGINCEISHCVKRALKIALIIGAKKLATYSRQALNRMYDICETTFASQMI